MCPSNCTFVRIHHKKSYSPKPDVKLLTVAPLIWVILQVSLTFSGYSDVENDKCHYSHLVLIWIL